jgi:hypothetical protein
MTTFVLVHGGLATEARVHACRRAHRRRLGRRAHGAWWPPESGRDRVVFFPRTMLTRGPKPVTRGWGLWPRVITSGHERRDIQ